MRSRLFFLVGLLFAVFLAVKAQKPPAYFNQYVTELDNSKIDLITTDLPKSVTYTMVFSRKACPKCRQLRDTIDKVAKELPSQVTFTGVDIDDYGVDSILKQINIDPKTPVTSLPMLKLLTPQAITDVDITGMNVKTLKEAALAQLN